MKGSIVLVAVVMSFSSMCLGQKASLLFPVIVAQKALVNQIGNIPSTTLLTPKKSGLFRISAYEVTFASGGPAPFMVFTYSDDGGPAYQYFQFFGQEPGCPVQGSYPPLTCNYSTVIRAVAKVPVQYSVEVYGDALPYDLFITVEQLQ
jgi:hypothetical protein